MRAPVPLSLTQAKVLASVDRQKKALRYAGEPTRISFIAIGTPRGLLHGGKDTRKVSQAIQSVGERSSGIMTGKIYRSSHAARLARISRACGASHFSQLHWFFSNADAHVRSDRDPASH